MNDTEREVEEIVDRIGLGGLLMSLEEVCYGKAEHLRSNWQDDGSAKAWERSARALDAARKKIRDFGM